MKIHRNIIQFILRHGCFIGLLSGVLAACTVSPPQTSTGSLASSPPETLFTRVERFFNSGQNPEAVLAAREMINAYPEHFRIDEVYLMAARAAHQQNKYDEAIKFARLIPEKHPDSANREKALLLTAECLIETGNHAESADALLQVLGGTADPAVKTEASETLRRLVRDHLTPQDLEILAGKYPDSAFAEELSLKIAKQEYARGNYEKCYQLLTELLYHFPESKHSLEARRLLKMSAEAKAGSTAALEHVNPYKIGVIFPVTGGQSVYGRYFEQGVSMAVEEFNQTHEFAVIPVSADTRGNPIDAAIAVRKLALEEGVLSIVGSVFTMPTITASVEANARGIPILSPFVSSGRINEIGPWVFQTKVPQEVEVTAIATAAVSGLLIERFAVLTPGFGEGRQLGDLFGREIKRLGGELVALEYYEEGETNFRQQLEAILEAAPEALFIPGSTDELILILPQINFYDMQVRLLGLSNWDSDKLIRLARSEIENALFPMAAYHGKDRETYTQFTQSYQEQFGGELNPVSVAGYFGTRLMLRGIESGVSDRKQMRDFLYGELSQRAEHRMGEAQMISIMTVRSGRLQEYRVPTHSDQ